MSIYLRIYRTKIVTRVLLIQMSVYFHFTMLEKQSERSTMSRREESAQVNLGWKKPQGSVLLPSGGTPGLFLFYTMLNFHFGTLNLKENFN